jgi:glycosyltransferase involved in cell wall biosynthesis
LAVYSVDLSGVFYENLKKNVAKIHIYGISSDYRTIFFSSWKIWNIMKKGDYDIVHSNIDFFNSIILGLAYFAKIKKRISNSHRSISENERKIFTKRLKYSIRCLFRPLIIIFATDRWAVSQMAGEWLYGRKVKFTVMINGVCSEQYKYDHNLYMQKRAELNFCDKLIILNVGSFEITKNHKFLFDIFEKICKLIVESKLILVGDGPMREELINYAIQKGINDKINFLGLINNVADILCVSDVFISPSISEGFGLAILEAQAAGLPCFISDSVPDIANVVNTEKISLSESPEKWADIIVHKMKNFKRKDENKIIKQAGFDVIDVVKKIEEEYLL